MVVSLTLRKMRPTDFGGHALIPSMLVFRRPIFVGPRNPSTIIHRLWDRVPSTLWREADSSLFRGFGTTISFGAAL